MSGMRPPPSEVGEERRDAAVRRFEELRPEEEGLAGGKGATLARLYRAGCRVPEGVIVLPGAFDLDELTAEAWRDVVDFLRGVWSEDPAATFAVRSSARVEDSARASFAGQFESVLDAGSEAEVRRAIRLVQQSRKSERVRAYCRAKGMEAIHSLAVIVQRMVRAELSGVLFTVDPVTGDRTVMAGSLVHGLGEGLVSGATTGETFTIRRRRNVYRGPAGLAGQATQLARLGKQLEEMLGHPQDIEFSVAHGELFLLQSRPITNLVAHDPTTGEWNDSRRGDFLWSNVNFGEAVSAPMTPLTWTVIRLVLEDWQFLPGYRSAGNIGGRPYLNLSVFASVFRAIGKGTRELLETLEPTVYTPLPEGMEIPLISLSRWAVLRHLPRWMAIESRQRKGLRALAEYVTDNPAWCRRMMARLDAAESAAELASLWRGEILPHVERGVWIVLGSAAHYARMAAPLRRKLSDLVGAEDADALLLGPDDELPANLEPLVGIAQMARGKMTRADYLERYGHRGPDEFELSTPRPVEDSRWLDLQVELFQQSPFDVSAMLSRRRERFDLAWSRFVARYPRQVRSLRRRIGRACSWARRREAARSEYVRDRWLVRRLALRAAEIAELGEDVFFLTIEELLDVLHGEAADGEILAARKETYRRYRALPPYPSVIRGRFEPLSWAADPRRRSDFFDSHQAALPREGRATVGRSVRGAAGSAGVVEGTVRVLERPNDGARLQPGEILVTVQTDIEWTPLFSRVAAVVTDVGAPFSHAAIVARELGIPAVVGCGDATMRLRSGDRVIVDGGRGEVRPLAVA